MRRLACRAQRETRQRTLDSELKRLKNEIADSCRMFDHRLKNLQAQRLAVVRHVYRHELIALGLVGDIANVS